jgi:hypothetical protein
MSLFSYEICFQPAAEDPPPAPDTFMRPVLLFNSCDGYHAAFAKYDEEGEFICFSEWMEPMPIPKDHYTAWAFLPDELDVRFDFKPD